MTALTPDVVVIGGGPAGLTAAAELRRHGVGDVLVVERESSTGGIPRHSDHTGYGLRDLRRVLTGPRYAAMLGQRALDAGATVLTDAMVTGWASGDQLDLSVTSPAGLLEVRPRAVVLATGARERPRPARRIPGDRPAGVLTTGHLQNLVHLHHDHAAVGRRAVVVGGELVSWSAVLTLRHAGCRTVLMTTEHPTPEAYLAFRVPGRLRYGVRVAASTRVTRIIGHGRVAGVEVEHVATGEREVVDCDTVVLTGDWIPDHELARSGGLALDDRSLAPVVDTALRTSRPGVFAVGNLLHPVDTADVAALDGRHVAATVTRWLAEDAVPAQGVEITTEAPLRWVAPARFRPGDPAPPRDRLVLWTDELVRSPRVVVRQDGQVLTRRRLPWPAAPGRAFRVPWAMLSAADPTGGPVSLGVG